MAHDGWAKIPGFRPYLALHSVVNGSQKSAALAAQKSTSEFFKMKAPMGPGRYCLGRGLLILTCATL